MKSQINDRIVMVLAMGIIALLFHLTSANAATTGTTGLTTTSLDALRDTVIGYSETYGRPIGIFLVIGGSIFMLRTVGGGVIAIAAGLVAVLAVQIIDEAAQGATITPVVTLVAMGPIEWAISFYGLLALRVVTAVELWAMIPFAVWIRRKNA